jgi:SAM-dependent methyltransferase
MDGKTLTTTEMTPGPAAAASAAACLLCGRSGAATFFEQARVPVLCNAPCETREAALRFPTGRIELAFCPECGAVFNRAFQPGAIAYDQQYENSLHFSARFQEYITGLAGDLAARHGLRGKDIIEIGSGKGDFLALLCELGQNRGVGFDPTYEPDRLQQEAAGRIQIIPDLYSDQYGHLACDFLCCRHTLEHVQAPAAFLKSIRRALGEKRETVVFFEVPNVLYTLRHQGIWDIIYEHVSYFWAQPLSRLFAECGFRVRDVRETYEGQFLCIEAVPGAAGEGALYGREELARVAAEARSFGQTFRVQVEASRQELERIRQRGQRAVIWGAGSKGVTFLNIFRDCESLQYAVDINPHKQGKFVPGTGQAIVPPSFLTQHKPDVVFLMNPIYREEIAEQLAGLAIEAEVVGV